MAFGKSQLPANVTGFGGTAAQKAAHATRRTKRKGGGGAFYWKDIFRASQVEALWVRLVMGSYVTDRPDEDGNIYQEETPWVERVEHYLQRTKAGALCSAGALRWFKDKHDACLGCDEYWAYPKDQKTISMGAKFGIGVIDYRNFHKMPSLDKQGNIRTDKQGQPYLDWNACRGQGCTGCQTAQEHKQGHGQGWLVSKTHFNQLMAYNDNTAIGAHCGTCLQQNAISTNMWCCGNPECGDVIFDMTTSTVAKEQLDAVVNNLFTCTRCQIPAYPVEVIQCTTCTPQGNVPRRATVFDCNLLIKLIPTGEGNNTTLIVQQWDGPNAIQAPYDAIAGDMPNLDNKFAITSLETQAKLWNMQVPGQAPPQQQQMGQPQQQQNMGAGTQQPQQGPPQQQGFAPGGAPQQPQQMGQQPQQMGQQPQQAAPPSPQQFATPYGGAPQQQQVAQPAAYPAMPNTAPQQPPPMAQNPPPQQQAAPGGFARSPQPVGQPPQQPLQHGLPPNQVSDDPGPSDEDQPEE